MIVQLYPFMFLWKPKQTRITSGFGPRQNRMLWLVFLPIQGQIEAVDKVPIRKVNHHDQKGKKQTDKEDNLNIRTNTDK